MEINSNSNNEQGKNSYGILVPLKYIKKALLRIWNFLFKALSIGFKSIS